MVSRGSKGGARDARPPRGPPSLISMQFSANKFQNNRLARPFWVMVHPPRENPGPTTDGDQRSPPDPTPPDTDPFFGHVICEAC